MGRTDSRSDTGAREPQAGPDSLLASELQERFPLAVAPFAAIGERLGLDEQGVLARVIALREAGILRHVTPIFDASSLGYTSCLVAMTVPSARLDEAVAVINAHPGVSHNYAREHAFNVWFTIAVPPGSDLLRHVATLHELTGARSTRPLPSLRLFKIGVSLDVSGSRALDHREDSTPKHATRRHNRSPLTGHEIDVIRAVQGDLPLTERPFGAAAAALGLTDEALVGELARLRDDGRLRRIAGVLRHRAAGFSANGMAVWSVPDDRVIAVGESMASYSSISHCYERPRYDDWPYNLFTMIHARSQEECNAFVGELARSHQIEDFDVLYSTHEYKKVRPVYFTPDIGRWERDNGTAYEAAGS